MYLFLSSEREVLYVGKAKNLKLRVSSYFSKNAQLLEKTRILVSQTAKIETTHVESELEALLLEAYYIKKYKPRYNIRLADDKTYPLITITIHSEYPAVLYARRMDDPKALYFGPYPNPGDVRSVLRVIRRIFPFQSVRNHPKRICLYNHLGLCPCLPFFYTKEVKQEYTKNLKRIVQILEGKAHTLEKELKRERDIFIKKEEFEKANIVQKQLSALEVITKPRHKPFEYDTNPNLREDLREEELDGLIDILSIHGLSLTSLEKMECYDISNTQGSHATASMVVFVKGEKDGDQYRRFKIRKDGKPNDFAMMEEVLKRRISHTDWPEPNLIIVDGGKGQVTAALNAFEETGKSFPLVGLAKREETIIIPIDQSICHSFIARIRQLPETKQSHATVRPPRFARDDKKNLYGSNEEHFLEVHLPKNSPSLHLIQRIRDEAHRFAITYHKKVRSKNFLSK